MPKNSEKAKHIESVLNENRSFAPSAEFVAKARIKAAELAQLHRRAQEDYTGFWAD
jgi:acetyl-CoA synthetase